MKKIATILLRGQPSRRCACASSPAGTAAAIRRAQAPPSRGISSGYSIGSVVSDLTSGFPLRLLNNGADPLTLTANGASTSAASVALNNAYAVTIGTQAFRQTCSVSNGCGVATAVVTNVAISCGAVQARGFTVADFTAAGSADGTGTAASFRNPFGVALDPGGNLYMVDAGNFELRMIPAAGVVTTLAGSREAGSANELRYGYILLGTGWYCCRCQWHHLRDGFGQ